MQCPIDSSTLIITERQGVEIDYCPECRGVWLDRAELDKLIGKNEAFTTNQKLQQHDSDNIYDEDRQREPNDHYPGRYANPRKKRESFLSDLFDFGD